MISARNTAAALALAGLGPAAHACAGDPSAATAFHAAAPSATVVSPAEGVETMSLRLHRIWPGENRFCCFGWLMTGAPVHECTTSGCFRDCRDEACCLGRTWCGDACESLAQRVEVVESLDKPICTSASGANLCAWLCILLPSALYVFLALPYYWTQVHFLLPLFSIFFFFLTVGCLLAACFSDPGIIPRREVILASGTAAKLELELGYNVLGEESAVQPRSGAGQHLRMTVPAELRQQGYRWCTTCRIVKPPRASHCPDCNNCVLRFDHHCPFVNNCVGQRNYLFFMGFTTSVCFLAMLVIPMLLWYFLGSAVRADPREPATDQSVDSEAVTRGVLITLAVAAGGASLFVLGLWSYHVFLICSGMTTKEHWKGKRVAELPGMGDDLTIFARRGPALFSRRAVVEAVRPSRPVGRKWQLNGLELNVVEG